MADGGESGGGGGAGVMSGGPQGIHQDAVLRRVRRARELMKARGFDALVVYSAPMGLGPTTTTSGAVRYLTGWKSPYVTIDSLLLLPADGAPVLFVHNPFAKRFAEEQDLWVTDIRPEVRSGAIARRILNGQYRAARIGLVGRREMPFAIYQGLTAEPAHFQMVDADDLMAYQRAIKEPIEVDCHRAAARISDSMLAACMDLAATSEIHADALMIEMEHRGRTLGAEYARCWVDTGKAPVSKYQPWQLPQQVQRGDRVQAGTYVIHDGYWAHGLRMGTKGPPSAEVRDLCDYVVEIQDAGLAAVRPEQPLRQVVEAMEALIEEHPKLERWGSLGHGLGLQYEDPYVTDAFPHPFTDSSRSERGTSALIEPGMVFELHPNFLVRGHGTFYIGDVVLVTESGPELLTHFPRELLSL